MARPKPLSPPEGGADAYRAWSPGLGTALALCAGLLTAACAEPGSSAVAARSDRSPLSLTVKTPDGAVRGRELGGAQAFFGLPIAQPPVYDLAWKAPVEPERWSGLRDATEQEPACLQFEPTGVKNDQPTSLDCLYLDVYRPARIRKGEKRPVLVFYHGGAGTQGSGVLYGGQTMADRNDVIVVSTNYRLGAAGNLALPGLDTENATAGGNFALLDQVEALTWVRKSIGSFGRDPNDVTIFGQSAGARAVCNLLATPLAKASSTARSCRAHLASEAEHPGEGASERRGVRRRRRVRFG